MKPDMDKLRESGRISAHDAYMKASDKSRFEPLLKGA